MNEISTHPASEPLTATGDTTPQLHYDVGVVGLGYVGLTLATALADRGLQVFGVERQAEVVERLSAGEPHFEEVGLAEILVRVLRERHLRAAPAFPVGIACDAFVITVGTPLNGGGKANLDMIEDAARQVAAVMRDDALVVLRSTVMIGTARNAVAPILDATGKRYHLAMCPERTLQGKAMSELRHLPQIVGADTEVARDRAAKLFSRLTPTVLPVSTLETAEIIKLVDNTYRDVRFGFANEIARLCDAVGVDTYEVAEKGKLGYERTDLALPGLVGGPCLEKDPHILLQSAAHFGLELELTRASRLVNERQPTETAAFIAQRSRERGLGETPRVALLGMAFKGQPETDDLRGAMSLKVLRALQSELPDARIRLYDPIIDVDTLAKIDPSLQVASSLDEALSGAQVVVIANNHREFTALEYERVERLIAPEGFVYDYWNHFDDVRDPDFLARYHLLGNAKRQHA